MLSSKVFPSLRGLTNIQFQPYRQKGTGILMLNMGGPRTVDEVGDFLKRLFQDRDILQLPMQDRLGEWIAKRRTPSIQEKYAEIGGGSPILKWTDLQGKLMTTILDDISPETKPHRHYVGFRYAHPLTEDALEAMERDGITRAVAFSQYPQYSCATSGSSIHAIHKFYMNKKSNMKWSFIDRWGNNRYLIQTIAENVKAELLKFDERVRNRVFVLFSAHSLPMKIVLMKKRKAASWGGVRSGLMALNSLTVPHMPPPSTNPAPSVVHIPHAPQPEPHKLIEADLQDLVKDIRRELGGRQLELCNVAAYYFDGQGKAVRPMISILMARAINAHLHGNNSFILPAQKQLALVSEMIHTATLVHDDVIDTSNTRRGKPSVNALFGQKKAIIGGDYILAKAGAMVARLNNDEVTHILAQVLEDLVQGEFMQMGANEENTEKFAHYIGKTFNKTASLMAYSCKGVALLGGSDESLAEMAFQYGKHVGIAFQLIDDLLDFVSSTATMGKPAAADLELGLATAPVLFAAQQHPHLNELIERRFSEEGDVQKALDCVHNSDGLEQTKFLAQKYCLEAVRFANTLRDSPHQRALITITDKVLNRSK